MDSLNQQWGETNTYICKYKLTYVAIVFKELFHDSGYILL